MGPREPKFARHSFGTALYKGADVHLDLTRISLGRLGQIRCCTQWQTQVNESTDSIFVSHWNSYQIGVSSQWGLAISSRLGLFLPGVFHCPLVSMHVPYKSAFES